jgi:hypothetical protein
VLAALQLSLHCRGVFKKPIYAVEAYVTRTGSTSAYAPKGIWKAEKPRNWKKFEAWQPPQS